MLNINQLDFSYNHQSLLFSGLNLEMSSGAIYGLLGKNGAGKTTFLKIMAGLIFPTRGTISVMGHRPMDRSPLFLEEICFIPEEFYLPEVTVTEYVSLYSNFYKKFDRSMLNQLIREFDIPDSKSLAILSYGQKKKFLIAFGLATNCKILILDEPTNGLDIPSKSQLRKWLASSLTEEKTFIISTHQVRDVDNLIDSVIILDEGRVIFNQTMEQVAHSLYFQYKQPSLNGDILYYEKDLSGYASITKNKANEMSMVELELLFNFVTMKQNELRAIFPCVTN